jgi:uncharacterized membrane protein
MFRVTHAVLLVAVGVVAAVAVAGMVLLWPTDVVLREDDPEAVQRTELVDATLLDVEELTGRDALGLLPGAIEVAITARITDTGEVVSFEMTDDTGATFAAGQRVKLARIAQVGQEPVYFVSDFQRGRPLLLLAGIFVGAVLAFARWQGARALLGLAFTLLLLVGFVVPAILGGAAPVPVALIGALVIMVMTLYLSHGFSRKTTAAVVGTTLALALTGGLAALFVALASLTGFTSEEARLANLQVGGLSLRGLLLAGIIIGGLGVLDDVTMSQSSTVFELHRANPRATFTQLLTGALNVGRDHIAATVNTLFLAYAGASLPLLILFVTGIDPVGTILTSEIVAVEVVRTLVGSVGLIAAVPLTTALAAAVVRAEPEAAAAEAVLGGHVHGHAPGRHAADATPPPAVEDEDRGPIVPDHSGDSDDGDWEARLRAAYRLPDQGTERGPRS